MSNNLSQVANSTDSLETGKAHPLNDMRSSHLYHMRLGRIDLAGEIFVELMETLLPINSPKNKAREIREICEMYDPEREIAILNVKRFFDLPERVRKQAKWSFLNGCLLQARDSEYDLLMIAS